ncbi:hypothetical protein MCAP1_000214 [Malassezia caprae]|uniref:SEC7 domain-containing protein n=1 Tax=Malassezia caprae TaxID=1381934 RepID=A0AAF0E8E1_9BASI|nr:hypothetical protein MCAP1_000214 [Malassezia caprae]
MVSVIIEEVPDGESLSEHLVSDLEDGEEGTEEGDVVMRIEGEDEDEDDFDDSPSLDDDDYMDWLGVQLLKRKRGAPLWVIDDVHERDAGSDLDYSLVEANQSQEEWENASMFLVEQDMAPHTQLFNPMPEMADSVRESVFLCDTKKVYNYFDSPVDTEKDSASENIAKDTCALDMSGLPFAVTPTESALQLSKRLYQYTKQHQEYEGQTTRMLSANNSTFLQEALACYLERFHFEKYPIDMALRHFLSLEHLPLESQQVDRVLVAFSHRYHVCNPDILDEDSVYLLVFSLLLLHTDAFHKSVRPRISKTEFVSMTEASHVHHAILEYLYDNTSLALCVYDAAKKDGIIRLRRNLFSLSNNSVNGFTKKD